MSSLISRLTPHRRKLLELIARLHLSPVGVKLVAAIRHPMNSRKRKRYRLVQRNEWIFLRGRIIGKTGKPNILLVSHEASWTGAPIVVYNLAREFCNRYNVTILCLRGGRLVNSLLDVSIGLAIAGSLPNRSNQMWQQAIE